MKKYFTLTKSIAGNNSVAVEFVYDKHFGGYCAKVEALERKNHDGEIVYEKHLNKDYYRSGGDMIAVLVSSKQRNRNREEAAMGQMLARMKSLVRAFLDNMGEVDVNFTVA